MYGKLESDSSLRLGTVLVILTVLASAMAVMFLIHAGTDDSSAEVVESGICGPDARYNYYSDGTLEVTGDGWTYNYSGTVRSPWFDYRTEITKIVIGDGITNLGAWTFVGCKNVTELTMPITLDTVGSDLSSAFAGCYRIEKIDFTCGTDGYGYDYDAYYGNDKWYQNTPWYESRGSLRELSFADGIKGIGSDTFRELNITSLVIPESVVVLGNHAFYNCTELTELTIPVSLNSYGNENYPAFQGCTAVEKVTFTRGNGAPFDYKHWSWGWRAYNAQLAPWNLNSGVPKTVVIVNNVDRLGEFMFDACNIRELSLPVSLDLYESNAFNAPYSGLEKVTITKGNGYGCDYPGKSPCSFPWYKAWNIKTLEIEDGVTRIGDKTFEYCSIENLLIPDTVSSFGMIVFYECTIKNLTIPISLNAVWLDDAPAFHYVSGIEKVVFTPGSGRGFDYDASWGNNRDYNYTPWQQSSSTLKEIVLEDGITRIGSNAFRELHITSIVIPDSVRSLGNHTFYLCNELADLTVPITLDTVFSNIYPAFDQCNAISKVRFTAGDNGIGWDYSRYHYPVWCNASPREITIVLDSDIVFVGFNMFGGLTFFGPDGSVLSHTAENLRGHAFTGSNGYLYQADCLDSDNTTGPNPHSDVDLADLVLVAGFGLIVVAIAVASGIWIREENQ